jgi:hypothetical protein
MGKGWYILVGGMVVLIAILIGFAAYMTYEGSRQMCPGSTAACSRPPPGTPRQ